MPMAAACYRAPPLTARDWHWTTDPSLAEVLSMSQSRSPPSPARSPRLAAPSVALLDVDGTLLDSNDAHAQAWADTFAEFGYKVPFDKVRRLIGKGSDKLLPETV